VFLSIALMSAMTVAAPAQDTDHGVFDMLCGMHVDDHGNVRYEGFRDIAFERYIASLADIDLEELPKSARLAAVLNAYNACVIKNVLDHWPLASVMDVPSFFDEQKFRIAGKVMSLREIEERLILPIAPVLARCALTPAARGAPPLRRRMYAASDVYDACLLQTERFFADREKNRVDREKGILYVSVLFRSCRQEVETMYGSLRQLALRFLPEDDVRWLAEHDVEIVFLPWDWSLNTQ